LGCPSQLTLLEDHHPHQHTSPAVTAQTDLHCAANHAQVSTNSIVPHLLKDWNLILARVVFETKIFGKKYYLVVLLFFLIIHIDLMNVLVGSVNYYKAYSL
jgi:hypothetical protein